MTHFKKEIKDEHEGHEHYEKLAEQYPSYAKLFEGMAEDEEKHMGTLEKIDTALDKAPKMHKSKIKSAAMKALGGKY